MRAAAPLVVGLALWSAAASAADVRSTAPRFAFERALDVQAAGRAAVRVDRHVYDTARADLGDLRVLDERDSLVPFVLDRGRAAGREADVSPIIRNRGWLADRAATAVLDFGGRLAKDRLRLELSGDNFRRRVVVEGGEGEAWTTVVEEAWVFAVPGEKPARYQSVELPPNDFRLLRVTVHPGPDERERVGILGAVVPAGSGRPLRDEIFQPRWSQAEDAGSRESWLLLDLGGGRQPFHSLTADVGDARFFREAIVEARRDAPASGGVPGALRWVELGRGVLYRQERDGVRGESLHLDVSGRERWLRVRVRNLDDRPLSIRGVSLRVPVERLLFEAAPGRAYRLVYGSPTAAAPDFDLARTAGEPEAWGAAALPAALGAPQRRSAAADAPLPWTERHPALLWGGLLAVVAALGALTWRALRAA